MKIKMEKSLSTAGIDEMVKRIDSIRDGKYVMRGDNKINSLDSRVFGEVDKSSIMGKVVHIWK